MVTEQILFLKSKILEYVYKHLVDKNGGLSSMKFSTKNFIESTERKEIIKYTSFLGEDATISERIYCIQHDIIEKKKCLCGKTIEFLSNIKGYRKSCKKCFRKMNPEHKSDGIGLLNYKNNTKESFINFLNSEEPNLVPKEEVLDFIKKRSEKIKKDNTSTSRGFRSFVRISDFIDNKHILKSIIKNTDYFKLDYNDYKFSQRMYNIINNISYKKCEICKTENTGFKNFFSGYNRVCASNKCSYELSSNVSVKRHNIIIRSRLEEQGFEILDKDPMIRISKNKVNIKCIKCHGIFSRDIADGDWKNLTCNGCYCASGISYEEKTVVKFLKEVCSYEILENQKIFNDSKKELDILISQKKIAIEYNGHLWHSFGNQYPKNNLHLESKEKFNHIEKYKLAKEKDIHLLQICSTEWTNSNKKEIWKSILRSKLGVSTKIFARKCDIVEISNTEKNVFLNYNHMQGMDNAKIRLGLKYNNDLVCVMTFSKPRFNKNYEWEMVRFCALQNHTVVGGASKLFKFFIKKYNPKNILSYADLRYSNGNLYQKIGFEFIRNTPPSYFYVNREKKVSRFTAQKHKQHKFLKNYDSTLTEVGNMMNNGYRRVWDCGNMLFVWKS